MRFNTIHQLVALAFAHLALSASASAQKQSWDDNLDECLSSPRTVTNSHELHHALQSFEDEGKSSTQGVWFFGMEKGGCVGTIRLWPGDYHLKHEHSITSKNAIHLEAISDLVNIFAAEDQRHFIVEKGSFLRVTGNLAFKDGGRHEEGFDGGSILIRDGGATFQDTIFEVGLGCRVFFFFFPSCHRTDCEIM